VPSRLDTLDRSIGSVLENLGEAWRIRLFLRRQLVMNRTIYIQVQVAHTELRELSESGSRPDLRRWLAFEAARFACLGDGPVVRAQRVILGRLRADVHSLDEITIELSQQVGDESGVFFVKGTAEAPRRRTGQVLPRSAQDIGNSQRNRPVSPDAVARRVVWPRPRASGQRQLPGASPFSRCGRTSR
jgi:hypothetical protein